MNTLDKKSKKIQRSRRTRETLEVSYEVSGVRLGKRDGAVEAKRGLLSDGTVTVPVGYGTDPVLFFDN